MPNRCSSSTTYDTTGRIQRSACDTSQLGTGAFFLISPDTTWPAPPSTKKSLKQMPEGRGGHDEVWNRSWRGTFLLQNGMPILDDCNAGSFWEAIGVLHWNPELPFAGRHTVLTLSRFGRRIKSDATKNSQGVWISDWLAQPQVIHFVPLVVNHAHPTIAGRRL